MKRSFLYRTSAVCVLAVFFISTVPRDFIHLLANHQDTVDLPYAGHANVSVKHIHCDFLRLDIAHFVAPGTDCFHPGDLFFKELPVDLPISYHSIFTHPCSLRGPPALSI